MEKALLAEATGSFFPTLQTPVLQVLEGDEFLLLPTQKPSYPLYQLLSAGVGGMSPYLVLPKDFSVQTAPWFQARQSLKESFPLLRWGWEGRNKMTLQNTLERRLKAAVICI